MVRADPQKIVDARTRAGLTQVRLAEQAGVHAVTLNRFERGRRELRDIALIARIADACDVRVDDLLSDGSLAA